MSRPRILIAAGDDAWREAIAFHLAASDYEVLAAPEGLSAIESFDGDALDAVLANVARPDARVLEALHLLRQRWPLLPTFVIADHSTDSERVDALLAGVDELTSGPLSPRELLARLRGVLRRGPRSLTGSAATLIAEGDMTIDPERVLVTVARRPLDLTPQEYKLLLTLAEARPHAVDRQEIFRRIWRGDLARENRSVDVLVTRVRRRIDRHGCAFTYVQTVRGIGYRYLSVPRVGGTVGPIGESETGHLGSQVLSRRRSVKPER